jgi:probable F420-dependent oxidoreductase
MKVGLILPMSDDDGSGTPSWPAIRDLARQAEAGGADSVWVYDHLLFRFDDQPTGIHEAWTLLSAVAVATERVELGTIVLATGFRAPGLLAKMATTLDEISGGRLLLGLGCGWHEPEYAAFGYPFDHRVDRFEESLRIIGPLVRDGRTTFSGTYHRVEDCLILPRGPRERIPILVAAKGPRMLRLAAQHADAWNTAWFGMPDDRLERRLSDFREACAAVGREPASVELTVGVTVKADAGDDSGRPGAPAALTARPGAVADALHAYASLGIGHVQLDVQPATGATFSVVLDGLARYRSRAGTAGLSPV